MTTSRKQLWQRAGLLFVAHAVNDGFGGFLAPLLPLLIARLHLSLALAGLLGTIRIVTSSVLQPTLGHAIDRAPRPSLVVIGPLLSVAAIPLLGIAPNYAVLVGLLLVSGLGTALFHPAAAVLVTTGRPARAGSMMALFSSGGTLGPALAPLALVAVTAGGTAAQQTPWLIVPGLILVAAFAIPLRRLVPEAAVSDRHPAAPAPLPPSLAILWTAIVLASMASVAFSTFLAVLVTTRGGSPWLAGAAISAFFIGGSVCEFLAGNLSDRIGRKLVLMGTMALATPCLCALLYAPVAALLPLAAIAGGLSLSYSPVGIVAAHECAPGRTGLVSGLVMGLAWGVAGIALTPVGGLADRYGLVQVMTFVSFLPLLAAGLLFFFREGPRQRPEANPPCPCATR